MWTLLGEGWKWINLKQSSNIYLILEIVIENIWKRFWMLLWAWNFQLLNLYGGNFGDLNTITTGMNAKKKIICQSELN